MTIPIEVRIFFDASVIGAAKLLEPDDPRIVYPGHPNWPLDQTVTDEEWLPVVGGDGWLVITRDRKMRYRTAERQALIDNGVRIVNVATKANLSVGGMVELLQIHWSKIENTLSRPPALYHLTSTGLTQMLAYE